MINRKNGYDLKIGQYFPDASKYAFTFISLLILLLIVYGNSFQGEWHFDDTHNIVDNTSIHLKDLSLKNIYKTFFFQGDLLRPVSYLSFAINYYLGGLDTFGYHIVNFAIHYITSIFLFLFIYNTLKLPLIKDHFKTDAYAISLLAVILWAVSPVQVLAVSYIVQRMASMAGMFYIAAMYFYLRGRTAEKTGHKIIYLIFCASAALLAFGSKETAATLPVSIFIYDLFLLQGVNKENIKKNLKIAIFPFLIILLLVPLYVDVSTILEDYVIRPYTLAERLLTEPRIIIFYITLLLYPIHSRLTMLHDFYISKSVIDPWTTIPAIIIIMISIGYALIAAKKRPVISFCILFFFLNHLIEGSFIPVELIYEHRNYIPSMLFFVPVAVLTLNIVNYFEYKRTLQLFMAFIITFIIVTQGHTVYLRNEVLRYDITLWIDNVEKYPYLSRPHNNLGIDYMKQGRYTEAALQFVEALKLKKYEHLLMEARTEFNLGAYYINDGNLDLALDHYQRSIQICPANATPYSGIAEIHLKRGNINLAYKYITRALKIEPNCIEYRELLSLILLRSGDIENAVKEANRVLQRNYDRFFPRLILAEVQYQKGRYKSGIFYLKELLKRNPMFTQAYLFLIELYDAEKNEEALEETIASLMYLKEEKKIDEIVCAAVGNKFMSPHSFDTKKILSIIKKSHSKQVKNIEAAPCNRL